MSESQILGPIPRRTFDLTPASNESSSPSSPSAEPNPELLAAKLSGSPPVSRTRSVMNLTSSTLFGIYSPTGYDVSRDEPTTPWGTGAQTPMHRQSLDTDPRPDKFPAGLTNNLHRVRKQQLSGRALYLPIFLRTVVLFALGMAYGLLVGQLHDKQQIAPVKVDAFDRESWYYMLFWGASAVALGTLQPWFDATWSDTAPASKRPEPRRSQSASNTEWIPVVRSVGAFIGIAFAIRKTPWESTMQVSLTLALVNPVLWYLIDRTKQGFVLSTAIALAGTIALLEVNPDVLPAPNIAAPKAGSTGRNGASPSTGASGLSLEMQERLGVWTWIASVLFCSCVCFGNIGRRLALGRTPA